MAQSKKVFSVVMSAEYVDHSAGSGLVHTAPGCGPEDYEVGVRNNLEIFSPISSDGRYTVGIAPKELEGMPVMDGQIWVIKKLAADGKLLYKTSMRHSYPHCWRCHKGLIFRATKQWFLHPDIVICIWSPENGRGCIWPCLAVVVYQEMHTSYRDGMLARRYA